MPVAGSMLFPEEGSRSEGLESDMPLGFESMSHGTVAFGFFNIETDMLLLNHYFFFAEDFCRSISEMAVSPCSGGMKTSWEVYPVAGEERIGNLMAAIHGVDYNGLIGEVYRRYPFPANERDFKQNPDGLRKRPEMEALITRFAEKTSIPVWIDPLKDCVSIGELAFHRHAFRELIRYIWRGGFPRWREGIRPAGVLTMREKIEQSGHPLFRDLKWDP